MSREPVRGKQEWQGLITAGWWCCLSSWLSSPRTRRWTWLRADITASTGAAAASWLLGGAFAMGMGIWSMHFIGMLAFSLPVPMAYDVGITLASMFIAIIVSGFALLTVTRTSLSMRNLAVGGVLMGIGICSMHYAAG